MNTNNPENAVLVSPVLERKNRPLPLSLVLRLGVALFVWGAIYQFLRPATDFLTYRVLHLAPSSHLGSSVNFFLFETPKVLMLLVLVVFGVAIVRSFFTPERTRRALAGKRELAGNGLAAALGVVTPFCSCSAVPLFLGFVEAGVPLGITFSFLISAPMVNEVALVLLFGMFGWKVALLYLSTGLLIAVVAGWVIGKLRMERHLESWVLTVQVGRGEEMEAAPAFAERVRLGAGAVKEIVGRVWPYVLVGIAVGAGIHGYVPTGVLASFMGKDVWWAVPAAVILGVPMYSNAAGIIPVVHALMEKGAALGTVLAFMMSVIALSLPEIIILRKVLKPRLIATFVGVVAFGILLVGYLFNAVL
jgi:uncharacterized membrane protein YraQ (UPF0718 family)